ncbi:MAG: TlpA family protein disulfide reductase [Deltaproteobacteria bacterium]|nr:TlpA family protein disulfide reductase [Deltaproteobacteria bacterium]
MKILFALLLLASNLCFLSSCTRSSETGLNPGDLAPDFKLPGLDSREYSLSSFRGKVVLLNFWASWCGPCVSEMPALQRLHDQFKDQGFSVVAVGIDDEPGALEEFRQKFGLSFPVLVDTTGVTKSGYKTTGVPESFIIDAAGRMVMFPDPADKQPVVRITGPREWDSPNVLSRIRALLDKK